MEINPINEDHIIARINRRILQAKNTKKLMNDIAVDMKNKAQLRFRQEKDPSGAKWARNSEATIKRKKSAKPGTDTGRLRRSITSKSTLTQAVAGTNVEYAPTFNYGAKQGKYGYIIKNRAPIPWGNVPSRRFVGFSGSQRRIYAKWVKDYLK